MKYGFADLAKSKELTVLNLTGVKRITDHGMSVLEPSQLKTLILEATQINENDIQHLISDFPAINFQI